MPYGGRPRGAPATSGSTSGAYAGGAGSSTEGGGGGAAADLSGIEGRLEDLNLALTDGFADVAGTLAHGDAMLALTVGSGEVYVRLAGDEPVRFAGINNSGLIINQVLFHCFGTVINRGTIRNQGTISAR